MAINTAARRKTISGIPFAFSPGVTPDASKGQDWRFSAAGSYIGFLYNIDSAEKRRAIAGLPFLPMGPAVTPNSAKDLQWRRQAGWGYMVSLVGKSSRRVWRTERRATHKTDRSTIYPTE